MAGAVTSCQHCGKVPLRNRPLTGRQTNNVGAHPHLHVSCPDKPTAMLFKAVCASLDAEHAVRTFRRRTAARAQVMRLENSRHLKARIARAILTCANNETLRPHLLRLSAGTKLFRVIVHKFLLTFGRSYGRIESPILGGMGHYASVTLLPRRPTRNWTLVLALGNNRKGIQNGY